MLLTSTNLKRAVLIERETVAGLAHALVAASLEAPTRKWLATRRRFALGGTREAIIRITSTGGARIEINSQEIDVHRDYTDHTRFDTVLFPGIARYHIENRRDRRHDPFVTFAAIEVGLCELHRQFILQLTRRGRAKEV